MTPNSFDDFRVFLVVWLYLFLISIIISADSWMDHRYAHIAIVLLAAVLITIIFFAPAVVFNYIRG